MTNQLNSSALVLNIFFFIFISIIVIFLAFLTTRFLSTKIYTNNSMKNIKVVERTTIGVDKSLILVNLDSKYYLISVTKNNIELLDKLENLDIDCNNKQSKTFEDILIKLKNRK